MNAQYEKTAGGLLMPQGIQASGRYDGQIVRAGEVIDEFSGDNIVVNEGLNAVLNVMFNAATQITTWYLGLFEGNYTPVPTVTAANITTQATETTAYDEATRQEWVEAAAASQQITNSLSRATFTFNATKTIYGAFLVSASAKSSTSGTLFSAARFSAAKNVESGDELLLTYTFTATST